jgi:hypothetical protein
MEGMSMSEDIIDLAAERNRRIAPDAEHVMHDDFGREMYRFLLTYDFSGGQWGTEMWAYSAEDAEAKVAAMRESLRVDGQVFTQILA